LTTMILASHSRNLRRKAPHRLSNWKANYIPTGSGEPLGFVTSPSS